VHIFLVQFLLRI